LLAEAFIVIQDQKAMLFQDISFILNLDYAPEHISRSQFSKLARQKVINHTLSEKLLNKLAPNITRQAKLAQQAAGQGVTMPRSKRSWGGFWGSVFSLASQDDISKNHQHELKLDHNELKIATTLRNVTVTNANLLASLQNVTAGVFELITEEKDIFSQIQYIMHAEDEQTESLQNLIQTVDRSTSLVAEYLALQTQTSLLLNSVQNVQNLVSAILTIAAVSNFANCITCPN